MKIRFDVFNGLSKSMDVDPGLIRRHTHTTNYEYETKQKIDDGVLFVLDQHVYWDFIVLAH